MAVLTVARLAGFGGKYFFGLVSYGSGLNINQQDICVVDLAQGGAPQATRISSLTIAANMLTAPAVAGAPAWYRWAIVTQAGDIAAQLTQAVLTTNTAPQSNSPWGGSAEFSIGTIGGPGVPPILPGSAIVLAEGLLMAGGVSTPNLTAPAIYTLDDNDAADQGGPGALLAPAGQWCQLIVLAPIYLPLASAPGSMTSNISLTIRGAPVVSSRGGGPGLPQQSYVPRPA
jgi:hypothetical protein